MQDKCGSIDRKKSVPPPMHCFTGSFFVRAIVFYEGSIARAIKCNFCARKCVNRHKSICSIAVGAVLAQYIVVVTVDAECRINFT